MYFFHFQASGCPQGVDEFCIDETAAERVAFEMFLEMSAWEKRVVIVTVTNSDGAEILRVPRLSESELAYLSKTPASLLHAGGRSCT